jgi:hypothetical protein
MVKRPQRQDAYFRRDKALQENYYSIGAYGGLAKVNCSEIIFNKNLKFSHFQALFIISDYKAIDMRKIQ